MNDLSSTIIISDRLKIIPLSREHADFILTEFTPKITEYMYPRSPKTITEVLEYIDSETPKIKNGDDLTLIITNKETGEMLGGGGAHNLTTDTPAIGIWIKESAHGNKYGREAANAIKEWIDRNIPYTYIMYPVDKRNIGSVKIAESLGGIIEDEYKKENLSGDILNEVEYRIYNE